MTDFLLGITSFVGAMAYAIIAVAVYRFSDERKSTPYTIAASIVSAWIVAAGVTWIVAAATHSRTSPGAWAALPAIALAVSAILVTVSGTVGGQVKVPLAILWPVGGIIWIVLRLSVPVVVGAVTYGSRGPLALGAWLAELPGRRERERVARAKEATARRERIKELEKELGL